MINRKISIIIPIIRPRKAKRCINLILKNAGVPQDMFEIITEEDNDRIGCPEMVKRLVAKSEGDLILFLGDDSIPQKSFIKNAL